MKTKQILINILLLPLLSLGVVKVSVSNGNWSTNSNWSPWGAPSSSDKIYIYHEINLNQDFTASDTIFVFNVLNLNTNKDLTLNPGTMILVNNANYNGSIGYVGSNAGISGNFTFQKWVTRCDGYSTYGSPFTVPIASLDWYYCYQCQPSWSNIYYYDEAVGGIQDNGYYDNLGGTIQRGKGFFYWYSNYSNGQNFPRTISLNGSINFNSTFNFNVTRTFSGGPLEDGYNLVSNPFPGTIDWLDNSWSKKRVSGAFHTWNTCTGTYASFSAGVGVNGGSRYIPSMQGFWVQATSYNPELKVDAGAMVSTVSALQKSDGADTINYLLRMTLGDDEIAVRLHPDATGGFDSTMDALKLFSPASRLSSRSSLWDSSDYAINTLKDANQVIYVKVKGSGSLQLKGISSFFNQYSVHIKDLVTNEYLPVTENMSVTFTDTTQTTLQKRFALYFEKQTSVGIKNELLDAIYIDNKEEVIVIHIPEGLQSGTHVNMYDLQGRVLFTGEYDQTEIVIPKTQGLVLLTLYNEHGSVTKKIL